MHAQALLDDGLKVGELAVVVRLFVARREGQVGRVQLGPELVEDGGVAEEVVDDGLLDGGCGVGTGGDLMIDELVILFHYRITPIQETYVGQDVHDNVLVGDDVRV